MNGTENSARVTYKCVIDMKIPSLNDYIRACRSNAYLASKFKKDLEEEIGIYVMQLPKFEKPIKIHFHWVEGTKRRDYDNISAGKKFILDAMVKQGRLKDDNRRFVTAFTDTFSYGNATKVIIEIEEVEQ